jgi:Ca2+-binding RTX toxin-like protein
LRGGEGADVFLFAALADRGDTILDVEAGDAIVVSAAGFGGGLVEGADLAAEQRFVAGTHATAALGQFEWDAAHGRLYWDVDGTGATGRSLLVTLQPGAVLTAADIHVIA